MVTKLYPYGKDDAHIGSVNSGKQYIISETRIFTVFVRGIVIIPIILNRVKY